MTKEKQNKENKKYDPVNRPKHYNQGGIEVYDFIKSNKFGYAQGNVVKYVSRYRYKGTPIQDLLKARWYLNKLIEETTLELSNVKKARDAEAEGKTDNKEETKK
tara:strand:- start:235 stop:546 length:312 start_codon:yes stop_codon:yes gene_type:complete